MAKKATANKTNDLLIPTLALSAVVLVLVGVLTTVLPFMKPSQTEVAADRGGRQLTRGMEVEDLQTDLLLLEEDTLETELSTLQRLR